MHRKASEGLESSKHWQLSVELGSCYSTVLYGRFQLSGANAANSVNVAVKNTRRSRLHDSLLSRDITSPPRLRADVDGFHTPHGKLLTVTASLSPRVDRLS